MATEHLVPLTTPEPVASDLMPLQVCSDLLRETEHPAAVTTLWRWIQKHQIPVVRRGGKCFVSFSDILEAHRDEVAKRD